MEKKCAIIFLFVILFAGIVSSFGLDNVEERIRETEDLKDKLTNEPDYFSKKVEDWFKSSFVGKFIEEHSSKFQFLVGVNHSDPIKLFLALFFVGVLIVVFYNLSYFLTGLFTNPESNMRLFIFTLIFLFALILYLPLFLSEIGIFLFNKVDSFQFKTIYLVGFVGLVIVLTLFSKMLRDVSIKSRERKRLKKIEERGKKTKENLNNLKKEIQKKAEESSEGGMSWNEFLKEAQNLSEQMDLSSTDLKESTRFIKKFKPDFKEGIH